MSEENLTTEAADRLMGKLRRRLRRTHPESEHYGRIQGRIARLERIVAGRSAQFTKRDTR